MDDRSLRKIGGRLKLEVVGLSKFPLSLLIAVFGLTGCRGADVPGHSAALAVQKIDPQWDSLLGSPRRDADDIGRFLAGLPARDGSPLAALESDSVWKEHAGRLDQLWEKTQKARMAQMRDFHKAALSGGSLDKAKVFYPFSGPDVLTLLTFFPDHDDYIMAALEPPGTVPPAGEFKAEILGDQLAGLQGTLNSLLGRSFFITREMDRQLRGQVTDGVLPVMLVQLVRMKKQVLRWQSAGIDEEGRLILRHDSAPRAAFGRNRSVLLEIKDEDTGRKQRLLYVSLNLDNAHIGTNSGFKKFVEGLGPVDTLLKSTSYMPHHNNFSIIRDLILAQSVSVVQDDTGVPFRMFDAAKWQVDLYGTYDKPYGSFAYMVQKDLQEAYKSEAVKPLSFRIGYGYGRVPSNLQVARRKS